MAPVAATARATIILLVATYLHLTLAAKGTTAVALATAIITSATAAEVCPG